MVQNSAKLTQEEEKWLTDAKVQALKFSRKWVFLFFQRQKVKRRRITRDLKDIPSETTVRLIMGAAQQKICNGGYLPHQIINLDETAINWGLGPTYVYCAGSADRGEQEITDVKSRVTSIIMVAANGDFLTVFYIFKHSKTSDESPDQTKMTVIKNLFLKKGFTYADGWEMKVWERELTIEKKVRNTTVSKTAVHKVIYIKHQESGDIITSQHKAWNDKVRMAMCIDLILKPEAVKRGGKLFLWQDNCAVHKVSCLEEIYKEANVMVDYLPPNMTYILQVLDLVVNGPLKAHIRRLRAERIYEYFQEFKNLYEVEKLKAKESRKMPKWQCPKPSLHQCIRDLMALFKNGAFITHKFKTSIKESFQATGCAPKGHNSYQQYSASSNKGNLQIKWNN